MLQRENILKTVSFPRHVCLASVSAYKPFIVGISAVESHISALHRVGRHESLCIPCVCSVNYCKPLTQLHIARHAMARLTSTQVPTSCAAPPPGYNLSVSSILEAFRPRYRLPNVPRPHNYPSITRNTCGLVIG